MILSTFLQESRSIGGHYWYLSTGLNKGERWGPSSHVEMSFYLVNRVAGWLGDVGYSSIMILLPTYEISGLNYYAYLGVKYNLMG
jgi:hypothetical protein